VEAIDLTGATVTGNIAFAEADVDGITGSSTGTLSIASVDVTDITVTDATSVIYSTTTNNNDTVVYGFADGTTLNVSTTNGSDTLNGYSVTGGITNIPTINGGTGNDTIAFTGTVDAADEGNDFDSRLNNIETIDLTAASVTGNIAFAEADIDGITGLSNGTLNINSANVSDITVTNATSITYSTTTNDNDTVVYGFADGTTLNVSTTNGSSTLNGFNVTGGLASLAVIDGGTGSDSIAFTGTVGAADEGNDFDTKLDNVETIDLTGATVTGNITFTETDVDGITGSGTGALTINVASYSDIYLSDYNAGSGDTITENSPTSRTYTYNDGTTLTVNISNVTDSYTFDFASPTALQDANTGTDTVTIANTVDSGDDLDTLDAAFDNIETVDFTGATINSAVAIAKADIDGLTDGNNTLTMSVSQLSDINVTDATSVTYSGASNANATYGFAGGTTLTVTATTGSAALAGYNVNGGVAALAVIDGGSGSDSIAFTGTVADADNGDDFNARLANIETLDFTGATITGNIAFTEADIDGITGVGNGTLTINTANTSDISVTGASTVTYSGANNVNVTYGFADGTTLAVTATNGSTNLGSYNATAGLAALPVIDGGNGSDSIAFTGTVADTDNGDDFNARLDNIETLDFTGATITGDIAFTEADIDGITGSATGALAVNTTSTSDISVTGATSITYSGTNNEDISYGFADGTTLNVNTSGGGSANLGSYSATGGISTLPSVDGGNGSNDSISFTGTLAAGDDGDDFATMLDNVETIDLTGATLSDQVSFTETDLIGITDGNNDLTISVNSYSDIFLSDYNSASGDTITENSATSRTYTYNGGNTLTVNISNVNDNYTFDFQSQPSAFQDANTGTDSINVTTSSTLTSSDDVFGDIASLFTDIEEITFGDSDIDGSSSAVDISEADIESISAVNGTLTIFTNSFDDINLTSATSNVDTNSGIRTYTLTGGETLIVDTN